MKKKSSIYDRAAQAIAEDKLWRAKEILQGNISARGYDPEVYERYGQLLILMGDKLESGRFLFLSGSSDTSYEESVSLFIKKHTRKASRNLLGQFPLAARLQSIDDYPKAVSKKLKALGLGNDDLFWRTKVPHQGADNKSSGKMINFGIFVLVFFLVFCLVVGFITVVRWLIHGMNGF